MKLSVKLFASTVNPLKVRSNSLEKVPRHYQWLWFILALLGVASISAGAGALLAVSIAGTPLMQRKLTPAESQVFAKKPISTSTQNLKFPELTRPVNILVLGVKVLTTDVLDPIAIVDDGAQNDEGEQNTEQRDKTPISKPESYQALVNSLEGLTDTMLMIRFEPATQKLTLLSVPRDTRTEVEGVGMTKLNEANYYGGPALAARATSDLLGGVGVDRYIRINVQGLEKLIDALGGVQVDVPKDMQYRDDAQHFYVNLKQGKQWLNGTQALQFLRYRHDDFGDIGRIQRQQLLMRAAIEQTLKPETLAKLPQILQVIQSNIDTNLSVDELLALMGFAAKVDRSGVQMLMVPGSFSSPEEYKASYWLPNYDRLATMMEQYFAVPASAFVETENATSLNIAIQDSTSRLSDPSQLATLLQTLNQAGYASVSIDQPWQEPLDITEIIAQNGDIQSAAAIRAAIGFGEVKIESTGNLESDITIRLGKDAIKP